MVALQLDSHLPSTSNGLAPIGSNQSRNRVCGVPPPFQDDLNHPKESYKSLPQLAAPPCNCPTTFLSGLKRGAPDEPDSVEPIDQSGTTI